jgi:hypothetical protein
MDYCLPIPVELGAAVVYLTLVSVVEIPPSSEES